MDGEVQENTVTQNTFPCLLQIYLDLFKTPFLSRRSFNSYLWDNVKNSILTTLLKFIFPNLAPTVFIMNGKPLLYFREDSDTEVNI